MWACALLSLAQSFSPRAERLDFATIREHPYLLKVRTLSALKAFVAAARSVVFGETYRDIPGAEKRTDRSVGSEERRRKAADEGEEGDASKKVQGTGLPRTAEQREGREGGGQGGEDEREEGGEQGEDERRAGWEIDSIFVSVEEEKDEREGNKPKFVKMSKPLLIAVKGNPYDNPDIGKRRKLSLVSDVSSLSHP